MYIPNHLHWDDKPVLDDFSVGEDLFYRVSPEKIKGTPYEFLKVSLAEISLNRSGIKDNFISSREDALFNISPEDSNEKYDDKKVVAFSLVKEGLFPQTLYSRNNEINVKINLLHDPVPCNYAQSIFRFFYNGEKMTINNFGDLLGKRSGEGKKERKDLRKIIRIFLSELIIADAA